MRFAPSPTGALHIGGARTALYNWLAARHEGGSLVLRIEDTDRERSTEENVEQILDALRWLELDWDEGPLSQAARAERHEQALQRLLESGAAYRDHATAKDVEAWKAEHGADRGYRGEPCEDEGAAVRLRVPDEGETVVEDLIRGPVRFPNRSYDDFVIARGDGSVLYNFAVAVDDAEMGITDVVRGDDHLSNTPKQLLVLAALGFEAPRYAHLPLLHGPDGRKLSKRHGAASVQELREAGYLPAAVRNYLALLGWGADDDATLIPTDELIERFRVADVGRAAAIFDEKKLRWVNGRYMRELPLDEYVSVVARHLRARGGRAAARRLRDRAGESADAGRGVAADPLPLRRAGDRREGLAQDDEGRGAGSALGRSRGARRRRRIRRRGGRGGAGAAAGAARAQAGEGLPADPRGDQRRHRLSGDLRIAVGARPRGVAEAHRRRARAPWRIIVLSNWEARAKPCVLCCR